MNDGMRIEKDFLGECKIPKDAYWGINTLRARNNFPFRWEKMSRDFFYAYAMVKKACATANFELGFLDERKFYAIATACDEIINGKFDEELDISAYQGGAGTSSNMLINEIIANRGIELLGGKKGDYTIISPLEDVNMHQSTNDTFPTALKICSIYKFRELSNLVASLQGSLQRKEKEFADVVTIGRTELQEAVPVSLGAVFGAFAEAIARDRWKLFKCEERLKIVSLGGTAVGTGLTAPREYIFLVIEKLREVTGLPLSRAEHIMGDMAFIDPFVETMGVVSSCATNIMKIASDLRIMNLLGEISLPARQVGSSIMPAKVNPVICEAVIQTGMRIIGNSYIVSQINASGTFQINEFLPLLSCVYLQSLDLLMDSAKVFCEYVNDIKVNKEICRYFADRSLALITAFVPICGYQRCAEIVKRFVQTAEKDFRKFLEQEFGRDTVEKVLSVNNLKRLGFSAKDCI